jgi:hypothetical protein
VAKTQEPPPPGLPPEPSPGIPSEPPDPDLLAAVVLHTLVQAGSRGLTLPQVARACERDPGRLPDAREVELALRILIEDSLASRAGDRYRPTRAAIRAAELSF